MANKLTERPLYLPKVDEHGNTALRRWRLKRKMSYIEAAERIGVSKATYYRYESGEYLTIGKANEIVLMTRGEIRYRDLIGNFNPEFA